MEWHLYDEKYYCRHFSIFDWNKEKDKCTKEWGNLEKSGESRGRKYVELLRVKIREKKGCFRPWVKEKRLAQKSQDKKEG